jgi:4a-hydroxytetrahydrobiopterin dehydratase
MATLADEKCTSCNRNTPRVEGELLASFRRQVPEWDLRDERLHRRFRFANFRSAIRFVDRMADLAEVEGHHPVFTVAIEEVYVELWTHAIGGLSENDFILAAKLDRLAA